MLKPTDEAPPPYIHRRQVWWGDTDSARIAFTGRFLDFAMEALEAWFVDLFGITWYDLNMDLGYGTPFRAAALDFKAPVTPRDLLEIEVRVSHVGTTSLRYTIAAHGVSKQQGRRLCFTGEFACVFVKSATLEKVAIPDEFRQKLAAAGWCAA